MKHITSKEDFLVFLQPDSSDGVVQICSSSTSQESFPTSSTNNTSAYLEELTKTISQCFSDQDWTHPVIEEHIAPNIKAYMDHGEKPFAKSRGAYIAAFRKIFRKNPNYRGEIYSVSVSVNEKAGTASVWIFLHVVNSPEGLRREGVPVFDWKLIEGKWKLVAMKGLCGPGGLPT